MAADTPLKRYSAMNIGSPWRGLNVVPQASISAGERSAVMFLYALAAAAFTELRMLCASMTVTPRLSGTPSISPAMDASGVSVDPALIGTVTIERC